ncbi:MAG: AAA family ATPase [Candidatus Saccharibacteria bacterium]|nr:AAA family ATPase [Candidatus Saccharibacteria bacterium]
MEGKKIQPRALLVFGAPCSGKSTFAEKFAKRFGIAFYNLEELKAKYNLTNKVTLMLIEQVAKTKQNIVIEGAIGTEREREEMRRILRPAGYRTSTVWVQTDIATIRSRLKAKYRSVAKAKEVYDTTVPRLEAPSDTETPIILSGKHTFETQLKHILAALSE